MTTGQPARWAVIVEVVDPNAYAEHLRANGDEAGALDVIDEGPGESTVEMYDDEDEAREQIWSAPLVPGVRYQVREAAGS